MHWSKYLQVPRRLERNIVYWSFMHVSCTAVFFDNLQNNMWKVILLKNWDYHLFQITCYQLYNEIMDVWDKTFFATVSACRFRDTIVCWIFMFFPISNDGYDENCVISPPTSFCFFIVYEQSLGDPLFFYGRSVADPLLAH